MSNPPQDTFRIGYALTPKKEQSFILPSLLHHASERGLHLIRIDIDKPLIEQGPFGCIIHKLYDSEWTHQLHHFSSRNPHVPIIDSPDSIQLLHDRISMLQVVSRLKLMKHGAVGVPNQHVVLENQDLDRLIKQDAAQEVNKLHFPLIAKPLAANGTEISHKLHLVFDRDGLSRLIPPVVLQEFVNHGGVIFKVYVVGEHVECVKRRSLPDISQDKMVGLKGSMPFSQISNMVKEEEQGFGGDSQMPSNDFVMELGRGLKEVTALNLFNFDVIRDSRNKDRYLVIDINYFPGYGKMPAFESALTNFFLDVVRNKNEQ